MTQRKQAALKRHPIIITHTTARFCREIGSCIPWVRASAFLVLVASSLVVPTEHNNSNNNNIYRIFQKNAVRLQTGTTELRQLSNYFRIGSR